MDEEKEFLSLKAINIKKKKIESIEKEIIDLKKNNIDFSLINIEDLNDYMDKIIFLFKDKKVRDNYECDTFYNMNVNLFSKFLIKLENDNIELDNELKTSIGNIKKELDIDKNEINNHFNIKNLIEIIKCYSKILPLKELKKLKELLNILRK